MVKSNLLVKISHNQETRRKRRTRKFKDHCNLKNDQLSAKFPLNFNMSSRHVEIPHAISSNLYWRNYEKVIDWQKKHETAYWKAYALSLKQENEYLHDFISSLNLDSDSTSESSPGFFKKPCSTTVKKSKLQRRRHRKKIEEGKEEEENEFEASSELREFFRQSELHRAKREREKSLVLESIKSKEHMLPPMESVDSPRRRDSKMLYGEGSSMICAMEASLLMSYESFKDNNSAIYWPNIPFIV